MYWLAGWWVDAASKSIRNARIQSDIEIDEDLEDLKETILYWKNIKDGSALKPLGISSQLVNDDTVKVEFISSEDDR